MVTAIRKGFTLVELLIVITILVILGIFVILLINPAEILAKSRDSQRISDLATMKGAMQLYLTDTTSPSLTNCVTTTPIVEGDNADHAKVYASLDTAPNVAYINKYQVVAADTSRKKNDGTGWVPINFTTVTSGAPLDALPVDPSADLSSNTDLTTGKYYRFACKNNSTKYEYEFDAGLESSAWGPAASGIGNKGANDGGDANSGGSTAQYIRYEAGNNLNILPTTASITP